MEVTTRPDFRKMGALGGRPRLGDEVSVSVSLSTRGKCILMVRFGETVRNKLGWTKNELIGIYIAPNRRMITLRPDAYGHNIKWKQGARSGMFQCAVNGILLPFPATRRKPYIIGNAMSLQIQYPVSGESGSSASERR